jgi:hypothetical protein
MNSGHQRGILVPRCVGQRNQVRGFATFGAMAYAMIGRPPGTFDSRTIPIELRRLILPPTNGCGQHMKTLSGTDKGRVANGHGTLPRDRRRSW